MLVRRISLCGMLLLSAVSVQAGSDRWIMAMTAERAQQQGLIHVHFTAPDGQLVESDPLKVIKIDNQQCNAAKPFAVVVDYKLGYAINRGPVGIYLMSKTWQNNTLCFDVPNVGAANIKLDAADVGKTIAVKLGKVEK